MTANNDSIENILIRFPSALIGKVEPTSYGNKKSTIEQEILSNETRRWKLVSVRKRKSTKNPRVSRTYTWGKIYYGWETLTKGMLASFLSEFLRFHSPVTSNHSPFTQLLTTCPCLGKILFSIGFEWELGECFLTEPNYIIRLALLAVEKFGVLYWINWSFWEIKQISIEKMTF